MLELKKKIQCLLWQPLAERGSWELEMSLAAQIEVFYECKIDHEVRRYIRNIKYLINKILYWLYIQTIF